MNKINPVSVNPVFTEFKNQGVKFQTSPKAQTPAPAPSVVQNQTVAPNPAKEEVEPSAADTILKYSGVAALVALPVVTLFSQKISGDSFLKAVNKITANKDDTSTIITQNAKVMEQTGKLLDRMTELTEKAGKDAQNALNKNDNAIWRVLATLTGGAASGAVVAKLASGEQVTDEQKNNLANEAQYAMNDMRSDLNIAKQISNSALNTKALRNVHGLDLISQVDSKTTNKSKYDAALEEVQNAANKYLNGVPMRKLEPNSNVWSVTAEFAPIKEGGLGSVPPEIQNNFAKLGITCPTILPMYNVKGKSQMNFTDDGKKGVYRFGDTTFDVDRAAMFKISKSRGDKIKDWQRIEVYVSTSKTVNGKQQNIEPLVFIKCNDYFNSLPYTDTGSIQETERFAFFSKAVYELEKAVFEPGSVDEFCVSNQEAFDKIGKPDAMLLNDWHAGAMAALSRYKAPCENASNILSDDAKQKIADMNMLIICHNAQHQGSTIMNNNPVQRKEVSENILNTLFDDYAADIVENAESGAEYPGISNVLVLDKDSAPHTNLLNMGICLSNIDAPVSKNYAKELETTPELSTYLQWAIQQKADEKSGTHIGIINGNDYRNINQKTMVGKMGSKVNFDLATYSREDSLKNILEARKQNKINFYNEFIRGIAEGTIDKKYAGNVENVGKTVPPKLTDEEIVNTPILVSSGRLVSQKGIKALCNAIKDTYANWDENHKGQPKPIIYISGQDGEGGKQRTFIEQLKKDLGEDSNRVIFYHGFAPSPVYMMCGDFFLMPSVFEPCGLTQGESFAQGTPVIAAAVGGLVDTIKVDDSEKEYGILTEGKLDLNADDTNNTNAKAFAEAMEKGLDIFFDDKAKYEQMVRNAIDFDQSWAQPDRKGAIYEYADALGFDVTKLPEINNAA